MSRAKMYLRICVASTIKVAFALAKLIAGLLVLILCGAMFAYAAYLLHTESFDAGESPSRFFYVAVATKHAGQPFELVPFSQASSPESSLVLSKNDLTVETGEYETIAYHVIEKTPGTSTIETVYSNDDYTFTSRYRVEGHRIIPLRHRILGPGEGMIGAILGLPFCALLFYVHRRVYQPKIDAWMSGVIEAVARRDLNRR